MLKEVVCYGQKFVVNAFTEFEPVEGFEMRCDMIVFWNLTNNTGETVLDVL